MYWPKRGVEGHQSRPATTFPSRHAQECTQILSAHAAAVVGVDVSKELVEDPRVETCWLLQDL